MSRASVTTAPGGAVEAVPPAAPVPTVGVVVRRGHPTAEELAALVGALAVVARRSAEPGEAAPVSRWRAGAGLRLPAPRGPGAWRAALG